MAGVYIHIPFCKKACHYCNFHFSTIKDHDEIINTIIQEIEINQKKISIKKISTIYFGGGTPSIVNTNSIKLILKSIQNKYDTSEKCEITLESNPDDITEKKLNSWKEIGINRLSVGIQSFNNSILKKLNRIHDSTQAKKSIKLIKKYFDNYSIDLMFGTPLSTIKSINEDLNIIKSFDPPHISIYNMTIEKKTMFEKQLKNNQLLLPNENEILEQYDLILKKLKSLDYENYEISNFSKKGLHSRHNFNYWNDKKYIGFGPSAHSYDKNYRYWNINKNKKYIDLINKNMICFEKEKLTLKQKINEYIITRIRTNKGINNMEINKKYNVDFFEKKEPEIDMLLKRNLVSRNKQTLNLTDNGKKISDHITEKIMF